LLNIDKIISVTTMVLHK